MFHKLDSVGWTGDRRTHVFVVDADGAGEARQLTQGDYEHTHPTWSPDGAQLVFDGFRDERWDTELISRLYVLDVDGDGEPRRFSPDRYRLGVLVGIASILMMFTALASALIVRSGMHTSVDWRGGQIPSFVYLSTGLIVLSSLTFMRAKASLRHEEEAGYRLWLTVTLLLGLGFLASQVLAWKQLVAAGLYLASNPHSSFFYVLTGLHGIHLLGGILALGYLYWYVRRASGPEADLKRRTLTDVVGIYWHFMDVLWVFLFLLLYFWR
jgi:cytochrome c oxidase subunit 3